jgi:hypothetical protein
MPDSKGVITIKDDQRDALACKNTSLLHDSRFGNKAAQEQVARVAKTKSDSTLIKISTYKPPIGNSPCILPASKDTNIASTSIPVPTDQKVANKLKGTLKIEDKQVAVDPNNPDMNLRISDNLDPK